MADLRPFEQLPFEALPARPRVPHGWDGVTHRRLELDSVPFGRMSTHLVTHGEGPPLLLVHGLMWRAFSWRYVIEPLSRHFTVFAPDLPGAGETDACADRSFAPDALATWLIELVDALGIRGCACIGNSLGGYLAMRAALADPRVFSRLVDLHGPGLPEPRLYALWAAIRIPGVRWGLERVIARDPERWSHRHVHYYDESLKSLEENAAVAAPLRSVEGRRAFVRMLAETVSPWAMRDFARQLDARKGFPIPLQLVYAEEDPMVPPTIGRRLAERLPEAEVVWLSEASHFAHVDAVEAFLDAIAPFLGFPRD